jgi:hypothetical protein
MSSQVAVAAVAVRYEARNRRKSGNMGHFQKVANLVAKTSALEVEICRLEVVNFRGGI